MNNQELRHEMVPITPDIEVRFYLSEDEGSYVTPHWHNSLEIVYMIEGSMEVVMQSGRIQLLPGEFIVVNQRTIHAVLSKKNKAFVLQVPPQLFDKYVPDIAFYRFVIDLYPQNEIDITRLEGLKKIFFDMHAVYEVRPEGWKLKFNSLLYNLLFTLIHSYTERLIKKEVEKNEKYLGRLNDLITFLDRNHERNVTIGEIAEHFGYHPDYLARFFKKHMGMTVLNYLYEIRVRYVAQDAENTELPIYEILERHGCSNYRLTMRLFKERYGMTPKEKRKGMKKKKSESA